MNAHHRVVEIKPRGTPAHTCMCTVQGRQPFAIERSHARSAPQVQSIDTRSVQSASEAPPFSLVLDMLWLRSNLLQPCLIHQQCVGELPLKYRHVCRTFRSRCFHATSFDTCMSRYLLVLGSVLQVSHVNAMLVFTVHEGSNAVCSSVLLQYGWLAAWPVHPHWLLTTKVCSPGWQDSRAAGNEHGNKFAQQWSTVL